MATVAAGELDGFNLLPWRPGAMRRVRRRRVLEWLAAALVGGACGCAVAGWQHVEQARMQTQRAALARQMATLGAPLAEAQRLAREARARRLALSEAFERARPFRRLFALVDGLARARTEGVALEQLAQHGDATELLASAADEVAAAAWLERLRALSEVEAVSVQEMKRAQEAGGARTPRGVAPIHVAARLVWKGALAPSSAVAAASAVPPVAAKEAK
ncbi:fimbrial assembly protein [Paraburkholderia tropica]|uniref:fimbrial assembly protein n=1 Tax=Paraburkholderia tropica TaxID=92647 RepID=UPI001CC5759C|nr:fimbrial assembly protein [Paraburkholderia tropica]